MPKRKLNRSKAANIDSVRASMLRLAGSGVHRRSGPCHVAVTAPNRTWSANQRLKLKMTPTTAAVTPASAPARRGFEPRRSTGRAGKDPQEARRKGRPKRDRCAEQSMRELRLASVPEAGKEADELGYEDQRTGRRLGKAEPVEHLARAQPAIRFHRLLRHIGEHRIGAPERHDR